MLTIKNWGICLDYKDVHIFTPNLANKQSVNMSLYQCQPGSGVTCVNQIPPAIVLHNFFVFQSTINVKRYSNPSAKISLQLEMVQLDDTLKYETNYNINDTILQTDQGAVFEDFKNETFPIVEKKDFIVYMRSSQKIGGSFASHGRMPNQDYFWQVKIHAGNKTTEIVRTYFTMIHVLSALGGQIYT